MFDLLIDEANEEDKYMMLSERANCNRLQTEIGRTLELSLCILMYKSLAELQILSDRWRFSNWCKMKVVDAMISSEQFTLSNRVLCDLVFLTNIATQQQSLSNTVGASNTSSTMNTMVIKRDSSLINSSLNTWPELKIWALQSLLLSSSKIAEQETHRKALAWLILAQSYQQESIHGEAGNSQILSQWLSELSKSQTSDMEVVSLETEDTSNTASTAASLPTQSSSSQKSTATSITILPASKFLNVSIRVCKSKEEDEVLKQSTMAKKASNSTRNTEAGAIIVKGYEMIHDEMFPVSVFQYECDPRGHHAYLHLHSHFEQDLEVEKMALIFKKVYPESFQSSFGAYAGGIHPFSANQFHNQFLDDEEELTQDMHIPDMQSIVRSFYDIGEDEFICELCEESFTMNSQGKTVIQIRPGENVYRIAFHPTSLGEYGLDRIVLHEGSVVFYSKALNSTTSNYFNSIFPDSTVIPIPAIMTASGLNSPINNPQSPTMVMKELENIPYTQQDIQNYFDTYPLIKIQEPKDLLGVSVDTANITPPYQNDFCYLHIKTYPSDTIEEMMICILPRVGIAKKISRQIKSRNSFTNASKGNSLPPSNSAGGSGLPNGQQLTMKTLSRTNSGFFEKGSNSPQRKNVFYQGNSMDESEAISTKQRSSSMVNELEVKIGEPEDWEMFCVSNSSKEVVLVDKMYDFYHHSTSQSHLASPTLPFPQQSFSGMQGYEESNEDDTKLIHRCVKFYNIPGDVSIYIRIPFRALPHSNNTYNSDVIYVSGLQAMIEGRLKRGICNIPFQVQASNQISCGMLLAGNAIAHNPQMHLQKEQFTAFLQTQIHNLGPDNVNIVGFNLIGNQSETENENQDSSNVHFLIGQYPSGLTNYPHHSPYTYGTERSKIMNDQHDVNASEDYYAAFTLSAEGNRHSLPHLLIRFFYYRVSDSLLASNQWLSKNDNTNNQQTNPKKEVRIFAFDINIMESLANKAHSNNKIPMVMNDSFRNVVNKRLCQTNRITSSHTSPKKRFCTVLGQLTKVTGKLSCVNHTWKYSIHCAEAVTLQQRTGEHSSTPLLHAHLTTPSAHLQISTPPTNSWIIIGAQSKADQVDAEDFEIDVEIFVIPLEAGNNLLPPLKVR